METPDTADPGDLVADAVNEFFSILFNSFMIGLNRFKTNLYASFADMTAHRWVRLGAVIVGYILIRPYIDAGFRKWFDYDQRKKKAEEDAQKAAFGETEDKKAKLSANSLRGSGKVLGEVENTDDEPEEDEANASGVPGSSNMTRRRRKKSEKQAEKRGHQLSEEQLLELLDWSESEEENGHSKAES